MFPFGQKFKSILRRISYEINLILKSEYNTVGKKSIFHLILPIIPLFSPFEALTALNTAAPNI